MDPLANHSIVDLEWIVPITPDRNDTVIGTIEDVAKHLAMVDPEGFAAVNKSINEAIAAPFPDRPAVSHSASNDPGFYDPVSYVCGKYNDIGNANGVQIKKGIEYLRKVPGTPVGGTGKVCLSTFQQILGGSLFANPVAVGLWSRELLLELSHYLVQSCKIPQYPIPMNFFVHFPLQDQLTSSHNRVMRNWCSTALAALQTAPRTSLTTAPSSKTTRQ